MTVESNAETNAAVFTFTVALQGVEQITEELASKLSGAGCDDALPALRDGVVSLDFDREAESLGSAVASAIDEIEAAGLRVASIRVCDQASRDLTAELSAWEEASDEDFESFENRLG